MIGQKEWNSTEILAEDTTVNETDTAVESSEDCQLILPDPVIPQPKKKRRFLKGLSIYAALLISLAAVALWFFNSYLTKYEAATPNAALETYLEWIRTEDYDAMYASSGFEETQLNTKEIFISYLESLYADTADLSLREQITKDESVRRYSVYSGDKKVSTLLLARSPEGDGSAWYVTTEVTYQEPFSLIVSDDIRLTISGTDVHLLSLPSTEIQSEVFPIIENATVALPTIRKYTLEGLITAPVISALTLDGKECTVERDGQTLYVRSPSTQEEKDTNEAFAVDIAKTYAKFVAKDASRTELLKQVHKESVLYNTIRNFSNVWFNKHDSYEFRDVSVTNYTRYSQSDFSCVVNFQPVYFRDGKAIESMPVHYQMSFLQIDGEWTLFSLTQTTAQEESTSTDTAQ